MKNWLFLALVACMFAPLSPGATNAAVNPAAFASAAEALGMMIQVVTNLEDKVRARDLISIHSEDVVLKMSLEALSLQASRIEIGRRAQFTGAITLLGQQVGTLHFAGDTGRQAQAEKQIVLVRESFEQIKTFFSSATMTTAHGLASLYTCPAHPAGRGARNDACPKCGQPFEQRVRLLPEFCGLPTASEKAVAATVRTAGPLTVGEQASATLRLIRNDGSPVYPSDLITAHTEKIHLLIVDTGLNDYHHEHPHATSVPGEYEFQFTPRQPGPYKVWADLRPEPMGLQEYATTTITAATAGAVTVDRIVTNKANVDGLSYELIFTSEILQAGKSIPGKLRITQSDGTPFTQLEPVMGAFAHLVGFYEDQKTILHLHPKFSPAALTERGGPEIEIVLYAPKQGYVRLFVQVQVGGKVKFAPFGLEIAH